LKPLRIGVLWDPAIEGLVVEPEQLHALEQTLALLQTLGHEVVEPELTLPIPGQVLADLMVDLFTDMASTQQRVLGGAGKAAAGGQGPVVEADLDPLGWAVAQRAAARNATDAWQTKFMADGIARMVIGAFSAYDVILTPALVTAPLHIGKLHAGLDDPLSAFDIAQRFMAFSPLANMTGLPAIALPTHVIDGLPVGVQAMGRACDEHVLLQLAAQLETQLAWHTHLSPIAAAVAR